MSKNKKGLDFSKVTPALVKQVEAVVANGAKHSYSVSAVYAAYNAAYDLKEKPQTCTSCVRRLVGLLNEWLKGYKAQKPKEGDSPEYVQVYELQDGTILYAEKGKDETPVCTQDGKVVADGDYTIKGEDGKDYAVLTLKAGYVVDSKYVQRKIEGVKVGVVRIPMKEGVAIDLTPSNEEKTEGTVLHADGTEVSVGNHETATGATLEVSQDGTGVITKAVEPQYDQPDAPGYVMPAKGSLRILVEGLAPLDITPAKGDPNKGIAVFATDGKYATPGTYETVSGDYTLAVQPGGKATIKPKEEDLT